MWFKCTFLPIKIDDIQQSKFIDRQINLYLALPILQMKITVCIILLVSSFAFSYDKGLYKDKKSIVKKTDKTISDEPETVSIINLIASPEKYDGKKVRVMGYLTLYFESSVLYLHKVDFDNAITKNGVWVDVSRAGLDSLKSYNNNYVIIEGTFDSHMNGHMDMNSGNIKNITSLALWPPRNRIIEKKYKRTKH